MKFTSEYQMCLQRSLVTRRSLLPRRLCEVWEEANENFDGVAALTGIQVSQSIDLLACRFMEICVSIFLV